MKDLTPHASSAFSLDAIVALYAAYAHAADDSLGDAWVEMFTPDAIYRLVPRENHVRGLPLATLDFRGQGMLRDRVHATRETLFHDPYQQRHVIGLPRIVAVDTQAKRCECEAHYAVYRTKHLQLTTVFNVGRYLDTIEATPNGLRFARKLCIYDSELIPNSIIHPI